MSRRLGGRSTGIPPVRRDLITRRNYLVPNSIVVTRGCPQHCDFCYKDAFFAGGQSFYTQRVDDALAEIARLPGRHLYFLDDHLLGDRRFGRALFDGMRGMKRLFQGAATVDSILRDDLIERAADAGLRSLFVGFETLTPANLASSNKRQNLGRDYTAVTRRLHDLGMMINGSFVFGMDDDDEDVFRRTVDWAVEQGITTATFHIQTPYPGTRLYAQMEQQGRITTRNWDLYDTRHVVYRPVAADAGSARGRISLGVPGVLSLAVDHPRGPGTRIRGSTRRNTSPIGRVEEVRARVEPGDPPAAAAADDPGARGRPFKVTRRSDTSADSWSSRAPARDQTVRSSTELPRAASSGGAGARKRSARA